MNGKSCQILTMLAVLLAAGPAPLQATERNEASPAASASTAPDKAAEAQRLAKLAAELAQRAAALAAESQAAPTDEAQGWLSRDSNEIQITDASGTAPKSSSSTSGWRKHPKANEVAIRFMGEESPSATPADSGRNAGAEKNLAASEAKQGENLSAASVADVAKGAAGDSATASKDASGSTAAERQALKDANVQLVAGMYNDIAVAQADGAEPMPAPGPLPNNHKNGSPYNDRHGPYDSCEVDCGPPQPVLFWVAGVEATFLNPDLTSGGTTFEVEEFAKNRDDWFSSASEDVDSLYLAPRIWLGVQGCKWGANLRYWHLQAGEGFFDPALGIDGEWDGLGCGREDIGVFSCNQLEAYTVDLEITRRFCVHDCWMQLSAGVRHAEFEHNESIVGNALADDSNLIGYARSNAYTRGTGMMLGWYGRRPIFPCSCVHWFYNVRWSALWGPTETSAETGIILAVTDPDGVATAGSTNGASTYVDDTLFIGEIQLGLEWDYALQCLPANAFFRAALEYQRWDGGPGFSYAESFAGVEINDEPTTFSAVTSSAPAPEMDLIGIALSTGLTW